MFRTAICLCAMIAAVQAGTSNVLDLYNALPESIITKYTIQRGTDSDTGWIAIPDMDVYKEYEVFVPCIIDMKNGYILINDEGTGGGSRHVQEIVLFRSADNTAHIGISIYTGEIMVHVNGGATGEDDAPGWEYEAIIGCNVKFLMYRNNDFTDVTADVLPRIAVKDFFAVGMDENMSADLNKAVDLLLPEESLISYSLPREGFVVRAVLNIERLKILAPRLLEKLQCREILLTWDKQAARFLPLD